MKAYTLDLRERVVKFVAGGGTRAQAARLFRLGERTVYRYLAAAKTNNLAPKTSWGHWRKLDPDQLAAHVRHHFHIYSLKWIATMFKGRPGVTKTGALQSVFNKQTIQIARSKHTGDGPPPMQPRPICQQRNASALFPVTDADVVIFKRKPSVGNRDEQFTARSQNPADFGGGLGQVGNVFQRFDGNDGVKKSVWEAHRGG